MEQLLLHLFGDFILQTDNQALNKKKKGLNGIIYCLSHSILYSLPFLLIASPIAVVIICITHFAIDRTNIIPWLIPKKNNVSDLSNFGFSLDRPFAISIWLMIITDNAIHLIINYFTIKLL